MLSGVVPALMTPFTAGGEKYDRNRLRGLCEHLISSRVGGLFVTGTTGEFIALSPEERRQVIEDA
ncbi:MAG TPA: dihydrodipicolinate synthase family protein, partial [Candidatus Latescibacteria bacterium]|nr:dihydrodipicolinate synthase family protein [Candidatus Latescibacterota bacterium]